MTDPTSEPFNLLTPSQSERLALLLEELGEAQQAIGKILRHGYGSTHPDGGLTNREMLERELGDVEAARTLMHLNMDIDADLVMDARQDKLERVAQYLHHQPKMRP